MSTDKTMVLQRIKDAFNSETSFPNNLRLPRDIEFEIIGNNVEMQLLAGSTGKNMQDDSAAFEGWALVLKRWAKFEKVSLSWERQHYVKNDARYGHYQRFLFRLKNFALDFSSWFSVAPKCTGFLTDLEIKDKVIYYLNCPSKDRSKTIPKGKEGILEFEYSFGKWSNNLKSVTNANFLDRQLPVGVFKDKVSIDTAIFSRGKSALDIWGTRGEEELLLFELKADKNKKIGIISELYLYCCVMQRTQNGLFKYNKIVPPLDRIIRTNKIGAYFFAPALHPLIDSVLVDFLNAKIAQDVSFHYLTFPMGGGAPIKMVF